MSEALRRRGLEVSLVEKSPAIFPGLDPDMAELVQAELEVSGVTVLTGRAAGRILTRHDGSVQAVELAGTGHLLPADVVFVDVGVEPRVDLAVEAGIRLGASGAIAVSERMETNVASIFAAGNCAETIHRVSGRPVMAPLGSVAVKQGRVAGENMVGRVSHFRGVVGTMAVKVFGIYAARTGASFDRGETGWISSFGGQDTWTVPGSLLRRRQACDGQSSRRREFGASSRSANRRQRDGSGSYRYRGDGSHVRDAGGRGGAARPRLYTSARRLVESFAGCHECAFEANGLTELENKNSKNSE